ncbi:guanine deaminase [Emergomyces pasteurianus Ep9510]|uniref:Probable guanine deaminase n=1 Tax=Emergomyces pasteurianus Ep9510 TaxID=1447872 RepID=A0A1J9Q8I5_9EURO|nr:guanine deaminase [Emergomyces pasteurianus Ep9510]
MASCVYTVYYGTFIHLPRLPNEPATPTSPPKYKLSINHGALWVSQADGKIEGIDWEVRDEEGLRELIKNMGWKVEGEDGANGDGAGQLVEVVKSRSQKNGFFFPGFIDSHIHAPQYPNSGIFGSSTLLDWLETYTFPLEASFGNNDDPSEPPLSAHTVYNRVVSRTLSHGTTCAAYFATIHVPATNLLATICHTKGQRALVGRVCMDNPALCPSYYRDESTSSSLSATKASIAHIHDLDPNATLIRPIITPRFAPSCTHTALTQLGALAASTSPPTPIQTHISENINEVTLVAELFPTAKSYADVYDSTGLLTPHTILAHAVHLSAEERALVAKRGSAVAHCPASNSAIGSGLCPVRELLDDGITVGLGTDVSGGWSPSILEAVRQACLVSRLVAFSNGAAAGTEEGAVRKSVSGREKISVEEGLYLATRGGAKVVGMQDAIGGFEKGMFWDAQMLEIGESLDGDGCDAASRGGDNGNRGVHTSSVDVFGWESWEEKIAKWVWSGDDRNIRAVWVAGRPAGDVCVVNLLELRNDKGELLVSFPDVENSFTQRHGYPLVFFERQLALKIFQSHVDKSKVLVGKAVRDVELLCDGVSVTTQDGSVFSGDILVGCDGIHSKVRQEMVRLANDVCPGYFPAREFDSEWALSVTVPLS